VRDAVGDTELGESGMDRSGKLESRRHFGGLQGTCCLSLQSTLFGLLMCRVFKILPLCCGLLGVQGVHCADSMTYCCRKLAKHLHTKYSTALAKLALGRRAVSVVASLILVDLGSGFVCLAAGRRSLSHSVRKAVIPTFEG